MYQPTTNEYICPTEEGISVVYAQSAVEDAIDETKKGFVAINDKLDAQPVVVEADNSGLVTLLFIVLAIIAAAGIAVCVYCIYLKKKENENV